MEIILAWGAYLTFGVLCLAFGWAWLGPRLPRHVRLAILWLATGLSALALVVTASLPQDYSRYPPRDLDEYWRALGALLIGLLVAIAGGVAALATIGRRRTLNAGLFGVGVYLAGVGLVLYWMLEGQSTLHAPALLMVGTTVAVAAALRLVGLGRWLARAIGLAVGAAALVVGEVLRGASARGGGPAASPREVQLLAAIMGLTLLLLAVRFVWSLRRLLAVPLFAAVAALAGTALMLVLRGPGEWAPVPNASSTTLYGLPLTLLAAAVSLIILDRSVQSDRALTRRGRPAAKTSSGGGNGNGNGRRNARRVPMWPAWPLVAGLLALAGTVAVWRPAPEPCTSTPYTDSSPLAPAGPVWASSPSAGAPRGAPDVAAFAQLCTDRTPGLGQAVYAYYPSCKWAQVDSDYPLVQASGTLQDIDLSHGDSPWLHTSHDIEMDVAVDPASDWLVLSDRGPSLLHVELESGPFPLDYRPVAGDHVTVAGRWIYDCGHDAHTEIHPAAVVASEHDEWRADFGAASGLQPQTQSQPQPQAQPQQVRVLRVWMNSAPGVVHAPLAPFDLRVGFPNHPTRQAATPIVQVVAGEPSAVQWTVETGAGSGVEPQGTVHISPPHSNGSAYFELLLGYQEGVAVTVPDANVPISYTVTFDQLVVHDDLRREARNTTGISLDILAPQLGFFGSGNWIMQATVDHAWRTLLNDVPLQSGQTYNLAAVPTVPIFAPGDQHLHLAITGYAENDPSDGVELASGSIDGPAVVSWDAGRLGDLCCGSAHTFTPRYGGWTLSYHIGQAAP